MSKHHVFKCRLDTLTDGSEFSGSGTIFLTIVRVSHSQEETIVARYALNGISPLISRLASDQALKLSHVRACFLSSMSVDCTAGLAALLLSLSNYSITGKLHVVASDGIDRYMEFLNELVLKRRNYPQVCSCVVPDDASVWWNVYQDEFIQVFAKRVRRGGDIDESESESSEEEDSDSDESDEEENIQENKDSTDAETLVYVIKVNCTEKPISFAVLPSISNATIPKKIFAGLPEEVTSQSDSKLDFILHINPYPDEREDDPQICQHLKSIAKLHLFTRPTNARRDEGILIRSLHQSRLLHRQLPFAFPLCDDEKKRNPIDSCEYNNNTSTKIHRLRSASTLHIDEIVSSSSNFAHSFESHVKNIKSKVERIANSSMDISTEMAKEFNQLSSFYSGGQNEKKAASSMDHIDANEIDLSGSEDDEESIGPPTKKLKCNESKNNEDEISKTLLDKSVPQLLVLGTGCASPSALRGSSGHALFLPTIINHVADLSLTLVLECGEGFLTNLQRYCPTEHPVEKHLEQIRIIWISHAHLDHYGGLPSLVHEIIKLNEGRNMCTCFQLRGNTPPIINMCQQSNATEKDYTCHTCQGKTPPIIISPSKVLEYLDLSLRCKNGFLNGKKMYIGVNHRDFDSSPFTEQIRQQVFNIELDSSFPNEKQSYRPFRFLKNVMVDHCPNAFGCLFGLNPASIMDKKIFTICYSGDTRPSSNLVQACNHFTYSCGDKVSFLLHEATFDNDERGKVEAKKKRHTTIEEAKNIASQISVDTTLLTHFSQRYPKLPPGFDRDTNHNVGFAFDGMLIPLQNTNLKQAMVQVTCLAVAVLSGEN
ncbi:hypothetical protein CTEN210_12294 [Chaetoceros tenuissimus]|uniref:ribonuclease Z n=1 Tax=Chaetoceros tenuissimus TaxID=426638 RepID=A0AAD3HAD0_9STRA|nr:hypothetical protein CTEN210_12294 [Chaetoceros tenuissimus]